MRNNKKISSFGKNALGLLITEIAKFRNLHSVPLQSDSKISILTAEAAYEWELVLDAMEDEYGEEITSDVCWISWRSIYSKYMSKNRKQIAKWMDKLQFLNEFRAPLYTSRNRKKPKEKKEPKIQYTNAVIKNVIDAFSDVSEFHSYEFMVSNPHVDELALEHRRKLPRVLNHLIRELGGLDVQEVWSQWRRLRLLHYQQRCPLVFLTDLEFLIPIDEEYRRRERPGIDFANKRTTRSCTSSIRRNYRETPQAESFVPLGSAAVMQPSSSELNTASRMPPPMATAPVARRPQSSQAQTSNYRPKSRPAQAPRSHKPQTVRNAIPQRNSPIMKVQKIRTRSPTPVEGRGFDFLKYDIMAKIAQYQNPLAEFALSRIRIQALKIIDKIRQEHMV